MEKQLLKNLRNARKIFEGSLRTLCVILVLLACPIVSPGFQNQNTVSGTITSQKGETMPGVNIIQKGTTNGTTTDADGRYSLTLSGDAGAVLVFSFIGYTTQELSVNGRSVIDISLDEDVTKALTQTGEWQKYLESKRELEVTKEQIEKFTEVLKAMENE